MRLYQNRRMARALRVMLSAPVTIAAAPSGYGKTIQARFFLGKRRSVETIWDGAKTTSTSHPELTVCVLDRADWAPGETVRELLSRADDGFHVVLLGRSVPASLPEGWLADSRYAYLGKQDLSLTRTEADEWFAREGSVLTKDIWSLCEGWPALLELCLREGGPCRARIKEYVRETVLPALPPVLRELFTFSALQGWESFTAEDIRAWTGSRKAERLLAAYALDGPLEWAEGRFRLPPALRLVLAEEPSRCVRMRPLASGLDRARLCKMSVKFAQGEARR